jgi:hypothetical protein
MTTQLHNPMSVWFLGAPVSKVIAVSTAIVYVIAETNKWHDALILGERQLRKTKMATIFCHVTVITC